MVVKKRNFQAGIRIKPDDTALEGNEGEIKVGDTSKKLEVHLDSADRELVTNDQTQTLENKTIDGTAATGNNTVTADADNVSYDPAASGLSSTDVKAAIDELKTGLDNQNEASEIDYDNSTSGLTATNVQDAIDEVDGRVDTIEGATYVNSFNGRTGSVLAASSDYDAVQVDYDNSTSGLTATDTQAAIDEVEGRLDTAESNISTNTTDIGTNNTLITDHIADGVEAHAASAISNIPAGNLAATDVQGALDELQSDVDTRALDSDLTAHINDVADAHAASAITNTPSGNLVATDVQGALDELQTDIDTRALDADLTAHTGASSGVHGVTGNVVGDTDTQTLTNKTLTGASIESPSRLDVKKDTKANLDVYATTATDGQFVFATDEQRMYQIINNALTEVSGGGAGSLYTYHTEDFETNSASNFSISGAAVVSNETTNPLYGDRSIKISHDVGDGVSDIILDIAIPIQQGQQDALNAMRVGTYSPTSNPDATYRLRVLESDDDISYTEVDSFLEFSASNITTVRQLNFRPSSTSEFLKFQIEITDDTTLATEELLIDNIEFVTNPLQTIEFENQTDWEPYTPVFQGLGSPTSVEFEWRRNGSDLLVRGSWVNGTVTATEARVGFPTGLISQASGQLVTAGTFQNGNAASNNRMNLLVGGGVSYFNLGRNTLGASAGNSFNTGEGNKILGIVPIEGWLVNGSGVVSDGVQQDTVASKQSGLPSGSVANSTVTKVSFPTTDYDTKSNVSSSTFTVQDGQNGLYEVHARVGLIIPTVFSENESYTIFIRKNGSTVARNRYTKETSNTADTEVYNEVFSKLDLVAGDQIDITVLQNSGNTANYSSDSFANEWTVTKVTPSNKVSVISPFKTEITTGVEYKTGEVIDGKDVYARRFSFTGSTSSSINYGAVGSFSEIVNISGSLEISGFGWTVLNYTFGSTSSNFWRTDVLPGGDLETGLSGVTVTEGRIKLEYTK